MITGIAIENFKGIRDRVELKLRPITLLFGANSAGKSSILHAIQYAEEILAHRNVDAHHFGNTTDGIDLGGFQSFVHGKRTDQLVTLSLSLSLPLTGLPSFNTRTLPELDEPDTVYSPVKEASVEIAVGWSELKTSAYIARYSVALDGVPFAAIEFEAGTLVAEMSLNCDHPCLVGDAEHSWLAKWHPLDSEQLQEMEGSVLGHLLGWANQNYVINGIGPGQAPYTDVLGVIGQRDALPDFNAPLSFDADWDWSERDPQLQTAQLPDLSDHLTEVLTQLIVGPGQLLRKQLSASRFLGPIREVPARIRVPNRKGIRASWASGLSAWERLESSGEQLVNDVSYWLSDENRLNSGYQIHVKRFKELDMSNELVVKLITGRAFDEVEDDARIDISSLPTYTRLIVAPIDSSIELTPSDVGIGISQVVPVVVVSLDGGGNFVSIEQPELHVHPRLQAEIADLFLEAVHVQKHQFIIETHSEHLILRLLRRIRDTEKGTAEATRQLRTDGIAINYIRMEDGCSQVSQIDVDVKGEFIQPWPDDFFEIDFYERFN